METPSRPIIFLHAGQAGVNVGNLLWKTFRLEHGITSSGKFALRSKHSISTNSAESKAGAPSASPIDGGPLAPTNTKLETLFIEGPQGRLYPRALFFDLEPSAVNTVRTSSQTALFSDSQLICGGKEDASTNYARGYYTRGPEALPILMNKIRKMAEFSDNFQGFIMTRSLGGGTGTGAGSLLLQQLFDAYPKTSRMTVDILPSGIFSTISTEPYNAVLATHASMNYSEVSFTFENEALFNICLKSLRIKDPHFVHLNSIIAQVMSTVTSCVHLEGTIHQTMTELRNNIVGTFSRLHFPLLSYVPIIQLYDVRPDITSYENLVSRIFSKHREMIVTERLSTTRNISASFLFRGKLETNPSKQVLAPQTVDYMQAIREKIKFPNWVSPAQAEVKIGSCLFPPVTLPSSEMAQSPRGIVCIRNTNAICPCWINLLSKFEAMSSKKSFMHWYLSEGMEETEFSEAKDDVRGLIQEYEEVVKDGEAPTPSIKPTKKLEEPKRK